MKQLEKLPFFEEGFKGKVLPIGRMNCRTVKKTKKQEDTLMYLIGSVYYIYDNKLYSIDDRQLVFSMNKDDIIGREGREAKYFELDIDEIGINYFMTDESYDIEFAYFMMEKYEEAITKRADWNDNKLYLEFNNEKWRSVLLSEDGEWDFELWNDRNRNSEYNSFQYVCTEQTLIDIVDGYIE